MEGRRLVCKAIRQVEWELYELPEAPGPHEILIKAACSLISAGTEIAVYSGSHIGYTLPNAPFPKLPLTMGYALAGMVHAVGREVAGWEVGDRVLAHVPHGDWALCDVRTTLIRRLPNRISMAQGALARLGSISLGGVRQARITLGDTVVVLGLGLIGQLAARLSRLSGGRPVIGVDLIPRRVQIAAASGIHGIDASTVSVRDAVSELTNDRMADVVVEATGNPKAMSIALGLATEGGRVISLGSPRGKAEIDVYSTIHRRGIVLLGAHERLFEHPYTLRDPWTRERNLDLVLELLADGSLESDGLISHRIRPEEIQETYEALINHPAEFLGVLIEWDNTL
ncbi:MAG: zinc-binding dehydrogenase [Anaerolineae bacterium]|nr:zinc-binding dehydrogenase [Anaerolineae bacterium]